MTGEQRTDDEPAARPPTPEELEERARTRASLEGDVVDPGASRAVVTTIDSLERERREIAVVYRMGQLMAASGFFPDARDAAQAAVKIFAGRELGFSMIASMTGIHIMDGKPVLGAGLMAQALKSSGKYDYRVLEHDETVCRIEVREKVDGHWEAIGTSVFDERDAVQAELGKRSVHKPNLPTTWEKYPRNMLFARAMSNAIAFYAPDVFETRVYTPHEIGGNEYEYDADGNVLNIGDSTPAPRPDQFPTREVPSTAQARPAQPPPTGGRAEPSRDAPAQQPPRQPPTRPASANDPINIDGVHDLQTLSAFQWQRWKGTQADVCKHLGVESISDIPVKFPTPEAYREAAALLWSAFDPDGYAAFLEAEEAQRVEAQDVAEAEAEVVTPPPPGDEGATQPGLTPE